MHGALLVIYHAIDVDFGKYMEYFDRIMILEY